ncbi:MAG: hypothetical protein ABIS51_20730 [Sphingomonas sp.]
MGNRRGAPRASRRHVVFALAIPALLGAAPAAFARPSPDSCEFKAAKTIAELRSALSLRAVEIVNRAAAAKSDTDPRLQHMLTPSATFSLGAGDVGRPLGTGVPCARALARLMKADRFRFLGWDYIPTPIENACAREKVDVEFIDTRNNLVYPVAFTFDAGRLISAEGWSRSFVTGPVEPISD